MNAFVVWCFLFYVLLGPGFQGFCCLGAWVLNRVVVWRCVVVFCVAGALGFKFVCFLVVCFECLCCLRAGALKIMRLERLLWFLLCWGFGFQGLLSFGCLFFDMVSGALGFLKKCCWSLRF